MRRTIAIYIQKTVVWEFPLGPFAPESDEEVLDAFKKKSVSWSLLTDAEEPEGWNDFHMEIRHYS